MSGNKKLDTEDLYRIMDAISDPVLEMSDEDLLADIREDGENPDEVAAQVKEVLLRAINTYRQQNPSAAAEEHGHQTSYTEKHKPLVTEQKKQADLPIYWTNRSVLLFADFKNPIERITHKAQSIILQFMETGASIPIDPFALAKYLKIEVAPKKEIRDARTVPTRTGRFLIEFNPKRPEARMRYSICHEIIHTLFPDCREKIQNRATHEEMEADEWQLEMLCNVGAAELLMPIGAFSAELMNQSLTIENAKRLQNKYKVSTEALLLRIIKLTTQQCGVFSASKADPSSYRIDYAIPSRTWPIQIPSGLTLPSDTAVANCTELWYTHSGREKWSASLGDLEVECVGIPPYPNQTLPRVMGFVKPVSPSEVIVNQIQFVRGDATKPRGYGNKIIAQVVNDKTPRWGAGFGLVIWKKWPFVQRDFENWAKEKKGNLALGNIHSTEIDETTSVVSMICQHGYGTSTKPRIRYSALKKCLDQVAHLGNEWQASIHMPRIGSGQAGGDWKIIEELIEDSLCNQGLKVYVYTLPDATIEENPQERFKFD